MITLENAAVVVTGASRGIGRAIVENLAQGRAKLVVNYRQNKGAAEDLVVQLRQMGAPDAIAIQADMSDSEQASRLIEQAVERFGRIDVLVNNAGINVDRTIKKMSVKDWETVIQTNLNGYFYTIRAAQTYFMQQQSGTIVNISSFVGQMGNFGQANYAAAKAGVIGLTRVAALELARYNVTVNAVCPGFIETDMFAGIPENAKETIVKRIPLGRIGSPQDVARAVRYLIVDGEYMTGQTLNINGGIYM
ncbi:MAG TPA: 3-oxoacyl-ACP reductase family protein [Ktedonobacteraceae bacterium]|nr:3-oxoacyl-ACP reductase family protein [Ktedonobacteraceae bacterium]